jgi:hypothetical protein
MAVSKGKDDTVALISDNSVEFVVVPLAVPTHRILASDGCKFLLVFDEDPFQKTPSFCFRSDLRTPQDFLAKNMQLGFPVKDMGPHYIENAGQDDLAFFWKCFRTGVSGCFPECFQDDQRLVQSFSPLYGSIQSKIPGRPTGSNHPVEDKLSILADCQGVTRPNANRWN